jgi:hypothetical protein
MDNYKKWIHIMTKKAIVSKSGNFKAAENINKKYPLVSVQKVLESKESYVIHYRRPDRRGRRCGQPRHVPAMTARGCGIQVI